MIKRYSKSLKALLNELHECRKKPYKNIQKWLSLQLKLLNRVRYLEIKIQESKRNIGQLKKNLKTPGFVKSKAQSLSIKSNISIQSERIEEYKFLISCFKSIADGIAFTFINKFDIKPQNFKETAGFINGKEGLKMESKALRFSYKKGLIAILNDLTSVLKYNDLTIMTSKNYVSVEMKSSELDNSRIQRQKAKSEKLFGYLDKGETTELYGLEGNFIRQSMEIAEKNYSKKLNSLIDKTRKTGVAHALIEPGLIYFACRYTDDIERELDTVKKKYDLEKPMVHSLNSNKFPGEGYYPFSLSLSTDNYLDFLLGEFMVLIILEFKHVETISLNKGFTSKYVEDEEWVLEFYTLDGTKALVMSYHLLGRIFTEFVSPKHLFEDGFLQYHKMIKEHEAAHNIGIANSGA